jgi:hypothetical protein
MGQVVALALRETGMSVPDAWTKVLNFIRTRSSSSRQPLLIKVETEVFIREQQIIVRLS